MVTMAHCLPNYSTSWPTIVKTPIIPVFTDNQIKQLHNVGPTVQFIYRVKSPLQRRLWFGLQLRPV